MESETLQIYDEDRVAQGVATRKEVHEKGYWHETFHCWVGSREADKAMIYLQLRSKDKKDFPNLFDITAAGHILAGETVQDGVREVQEELGLAIPFMDLVSLGTIKDQLAFPNFIDNEHCHCFFYQRNENTDAAFVLQQEEVSGIAKLEFTELAALFTKQKEIVEIEGFIEKEDERMAFKRWVGLQDFVPHSAAYLAQVIKQIGLVL